MDDLKFMLVVDAMRGQRCVNVADSFYETVEITGLLFKNGRAILVGGGLVFGRKGVRLNLWFLVK